MTACTRCLRRSYLIGQLAPRIAGILGRPGARPHALLELDEDSLIESVTTDAGADSARAFLRRFAAGRALEAIAAAGITPICRHAGEYPDGLRQLTDRPSVVYSTADCATLDALVSEPAATVVGARRASPYASEVAVELGRGLTSAGVTVVSGLALGIDGQVHRGVLERGGRPVAVLGCGADVAYPPRHRTLYRRIREAGVVLSELPPGSRPFRWSFPARNRIMAGLGQITVVVEAADPSGSLITAGFAAELGRTVGAVPGPVTSRKAAGTNRLLRDGAAMIRGTEDVLDEMFGVGNGPAGPRGPAPPPEAALPHRLRVVLDGVEVGESAGQIAARTGLTAAAVRAALGQLELEGLIVAGGLGGYQRAASR